MATDRVGRSAPAAAGGRRTPAVGGRFSTLAFAIASLMLAASPAAARDIAKNDLDMAGHTLVGLPAPGGVGSAAVPLSSVAVCTGIAKWTGINGTSSCATPNTDYLTPSFTFGGDLSGTPGSANVIKLLETGGPTHLTLGAWPDGGYGIRSGTTIIGQTAIPVASVTGAEHALTFLPPLSRSVDTISIPFSASLGLGPTALGSAGVATSFGRSDQVHAAYRSDMPLAANWYVDPAHGSDAAACTSSATACATVAEIKRRWWGADVTSDTTINVLGDIPASDTNTFNTRISLGAQVTFLGSLGATTGFGGAAIDNTLYSGTVTSYTAGSATPAADDVEFCDSAIPTSFTASGLMAAGVIYRRTVTSTRLWWVVKDLGGKCARMTVPMNNGGPATFASNPLTVGNAFSAFHAFTSPPQTFGHADAIRVKFDTIRMIEGTNVIEDGGPRGYAPLRSRVWIDAHPSSPFITMGEGCTNCMINLGATGGVISFGNQTPTTMIGGGFLGTGSAHYTFFGEGGIGGAMVFQGAGITVNDWSYFTIEAAVAFYDLTISAITTVGNGRAAFMQAGMSGKGNSGKLAQLNWGGTLYYGQSATLPPFVAGSTSDGSPITIGSTNYAVSALPAVADTLLSPVTNFTSTVYETGGPTLLTVGAVANGAMVKRNGATLIGAQSGVDFAPAGNYITGTTGDVVATGPGSVPATIQSDAVTNPKLANMASQTFKGRTTAGTGDPEDLTATQATAMLNVFDATHQGLVPASGGGTLNFQRADGTWAVPAGSGGTITSVAGTAGRISATGTPAVTIDLVNTAVTPGSYTYGGFSVDAAGRLTAASSGATPAPNTATYILQTANGSLPNGQALTSLSDGVMEKTAGGVVSTFVAGANRIAVGSGTAGALTDSANLKFNGQTFGLALQEVQVFNASTSTSAFAGFRAGTDASYTNGIGIGMTGTNWSGGALGTNVGLVEVAAGSSPMVISNAGTGKLSFTTTSSHLERMAILTGGDVTMAANLTVGGLGPTNGLVKSLSGLLTLATTADYVPPARTLTTSGPLRIDGTTSADMSANRTLSFTVPGGFRMLASNSGGTDVSVSDEIRLDVSADSLMASQDGAIIWRDLAGSSMIGAGSYSQVRSFWSSHVWTLQSEAAGGGLVRNMLINAGTGNLEADGDFVNVNATSDLTLKGTGNVNLFTVSGQPALSVIGAGAGQARVYVTPSNTVASATNAVLDAFQVGDETVTVTGAVPITTSNGFNQASFKAPKFSTATSIGLSATVAVYGAPSVVSGGGSINDALGFYVGNATARFDGPIGGGAVFEFLNDSTGNTSAAVGRVQVFVPGVGTRYIRLYSN